MAKIETDSFRVDLNDRNITAFFNVRKELSGSLVSISYFDGLMLLCSKETDSIPWKYLFYLPSEEWIQDVKDMGYEVIQQIKLPKESK